MGEYASKGVAGTGLGLGIAGTALSLMNNSNFLGGIFGCNRPVMGGVGAELQYVSQLQSENAMLKLKTTLINQIKRFTNKL